MPPLRSLLLLLLLAVMEALSGMSVLVGTNLIEFSGPRYGTLWLIIPVGLLAAASGLVIARWHPAEPWGRVMMVSLGAGVAIVVGILTARGIPSGVATTMTLSLAYWRGLVLVQEARDYQDIQRRFATGFGVYFIGILLLTSRGNINEPGVWHIVALSGLAFLFTAMVSLVVARFETSREPGAGGSLLLMMVVQLGFLLVLGFAALQIFAFDLAGGISALIRPFVDGVGTTLAGVVDAIARPIDRAIAVFHPAHHASPSHPSAVTGDTGPTRKLKAGKHHDPVNGYIVVLLIGVVVATILTLIWRAVPRRHSEQAVNREYRQERMSLLSPRDALAELLRWLRGLFRRDGGIAQGALRLTPRRFQGRSLPADPVRRVYAQVLRRAAVHSVTRPIGATPLEFEPTLQDHWPGGFTDLHEVTAAYIERRYGEAQIAEDSAAALTAHWQRLRTVMRTSTLSVEPVGADAIEQPKFAGHLIGEWWGRRHRYRLENEPGKAGWMAREALALVGLAVAPIAISVLFLAMTGGVMVFNASGGPPPRNAAPLGLAIDQHGHLWTTEAQHAQIVQLSFDGTVLGRYGARGSQPGQLLNPQGIAVDRHDNVFVADTGNGRVAEFSSSGRFIHAWGGPTSAQYKFGAPWGVAADRSDHVYVSDTKNDRIARIDTTNARIITWATGGSRTDQFSAPHGIAVDRSGYLYVADTGNNRILRLSPAGTVDRVWPLASYGGGNPRTGPRALTVDARGNVYATSFDYRTGAYHVLQFTPKGKLFAVWGSTGKGRGQLRDPHGLAVDIDGNLDVADTANRRIEQFSVDGQAVAQLRFPISTRG